MKDRIVKTLDEWVPPESNDARILGAPNIFKALHGWGLQPRTIVGETEWNKMRKLCYFRAGYTCEACGEYQGPGKCHAHELFRCNWKEGYSEFDRLICLCPKCHLIGQHSGRALTLYKKGDAVMNKTYILDGIEHVFKAVHKYNQTHDDEILMYPLFAVEYTKDPLLGEPVKQLIEKYDIHFYGLCKAAPWEQWRMIYDGKEYKTPYANVTDYEKKMEEYDKKNPQVVQNPFATKKEWDWGSDISKTD